LDTILLIGDAAAGIAGPIRDAGARALLAADALHAYEAVLRGDVDLVVTDRCLRDRDGFAVVEALRAWRTAAELPVVVLAGAGAAAANDACAAGPACSVLDAADGPAALHAAVAALLAERRAAQPDACLDRELGRSMVAATCEVFRAMMQLDAVPGEVLVAPAQLRRAEVIGSIGVAGFLTGSISLFLPKSLARRSVAALLQLPSPDEVTDGDLVDAIGEVTNMVGGGIKTALFRKAPLFDISAPSVYVGDDLRRRTVADDLCFLAPFTVGDDAFEVEFLMATRGAGGTGVQSALVGSMQKA
jgi:chemotaxis protein CheX